MSYFRPDLFRPETFRTDDSSAAVFRPGPIKLTFTDSLGLSETVIFSELTYIGEELQLSELVTINLYWIDSVAESLGLSESIIFTVLTSFSINDCSTPHWPTPPPGKITVE